jgi:hypothetical protein
VTVTVSLIVSIGDGRGDGYGDEREQGDKRSENDGETADVLRHGGASGEVGVWDSFPAG